LLKPDIQLATLTGPSRVLAASWLLIPILWILLSSAKGNTEFALHMSLAITAGVQALALVWSAFRGHLAGVAGICVALALGTSVFVPRPSQDILVGVGMLGMWCWPTLVSAWWLYRGGHRYAWVLLAAFLLVVVALGIAVVLPIAGILALPGFVLPVVAHLYLTGVCARAPVVEPEEDELVDEGFAEV